MPIAGGRKVAPFGECTHRKHEILHAVRIAPVEIFGNYSGQLFFQRQTHYSLPLRGRE